MNKTTWLITGASSGLGRALAEHVLKRGDQVVLAARSLESMQTLAAAFPDTALALSLDVVNPAQRASVIEQTEKHFGSIDFLVNSAGRFLSECVGLVASTTGHAETRVPSFMFQHAHANDSSVLAINNDVGEAFEANPPKAIALLVVRKTRRPAFIAATQLRTSSSKRSAKCVPPSAS
jgi:NAD(P)-dependent dehydrogenase (short-subunit alcohol dehydrogenase family)